MFFVYLKIVVAIVLSTLPFLIVHFTLRAPQKTSQESLVAKKTSTEEPLMSATKLEIARFYLRLFFFNLQPQIFLKGLRRYKSFRKFLHLMLALSVALIQLVEMQVVSDVSKYVINSNLQGGELVVFSQLCKNLISYPFINLGLFLFDILLFWYKPTNKLLNELHSNRRFIWCFGIFALMVLFYSPRCLNLTETMLLILIAAYFYPPILEDDFPKARKPLPVDREQHREAA